jgi:hypothetical protein
LINGFIIVILLSYKNNFYIFGPFIHYNCYKLTILQLLRVRSFNNVKFIWLIWIKYDLGDIIDFYDIIDLCYIIDFDFGYFLRWYSYFGDIYINVFHYYIFEIIYE